MQESNTAFESYNTDPSLNPKLHNSDLSLPNPNKPSHPDSSSSSSIPSGSSSSNSSILEFQSPSTGLNPSNNPPSAPIPSIFSSSSPIPSKKSLDPPNPDLKSLKNPESSKKPEKFIQSDSSDEETRNYLQALNDSLSSSSAEGNLELNEAVVINNEDSQSSSSENGEIFKDLYEESPDKIRGEDFYQGVNDSPMEHKHQAVSLMSNEIIEERFKGDKVVVSDMGRKEVEVGEGQGSGGNKKSGEIRNSLTEEVKPKRQKEDPKGSSTCSKCFIL